MPGLVSEIRLYRANNPHAYARMMLSNVFTHDDMRRLYGLFSKASLLDEAIEEIVRALKLS